MGAVAERAPELNFLSVTFPKSEETKRVSREAQPWPLTSNQKLGASATSGL